MPSFPGCADLENVANTCGPGDEHRRNVAAIPPDRRDFDLARQLAAQLAAQLSGRLAGSAAVDGESDTSEAGGVYVGTATPPIVVVSVVVSKDCFGAIPKSGPEQLGHVASAPSNPASQWGHTT